MVVESRLYAALDCVPDADTATIQEQYRRCILQYHPEKSKSVEAKERFEEMCWALYVLTDPHRRKLYDTLGSRALEAAHFDAKDVFGEFFGGRKRRGRRKPEDTIHELPTSLEDLYNGKHTKLNITRDRTCPSCEGRGTRDEGVSVRCTDCSGSGVRSVTRQLAKGYIQQVQLACTGCGGSGRIIRLEDRCVQCNGQGITRERKTFEVQIEPGMHGGQHFTFQGEGDQMPGGELAGDIIIILTEKRHSRFARKGDHLLVTCELSLTEALCGFVMVVAHLDGRQLVVQPARGQVTSPNQLWQVEGEGMVVHRSGGAERGHMIIQFTVDYPQRVSEVDADALCQMLGRRPQPLVTADAVECWLKPAESGLLDRPTTTQADASGVFDAGKTAVCAHQ
eukprot:TRINITY_DN4067_c4_g1_i1.p1 TRINITY_DN4067_c4_g1~~TRINITY_DN4067_c4_g1_i1.p1  ORF type:complete len:420 (+),score=96.29 TRINITY_DN4067_c4_g1_i1:80-1261(+)